MAKTSSNFIKQRLLTYSPTIIVGVCLIILGLYVDRLNSHAKEQELRNLVFNQLSVIRAKLEGNINSNAQLVKGLVAAISIEPEMTQKRYLGLAKPLFQGRSQLRNIGAAPDLIIRYIFPLQGNETAIGLNYRNTPAQYAAVQKAIDTGKLILAGPVNLIQGGQGFIARIPVFIDKKKDNLWGIISAVIDTESLYAASGLRDSEQEIEISIRGKDGLGKQGDIFFGKDEIFTLDPVQVDVVLPYGSWQLAAIPKDGWSNYSSDTGLFRLALLVIALLILIPLLILGRFLEKKRETETLLRGLFDLSPVGIALNDYATGKFLNVNDALLTPTGYTRKEFMELSYWELTPKEYEAQELLQLESMEKTNRYGPYEKEYIRKDGSRYPLLLRGIVVYDTSGKKLIWSIIEDISEQKHNEKMKNEFISTVSHELRTPLTSINGAIGLISGGAFGDLSEEVTNTLNIAQNNTERLILLINDLLNLEKLSAKKMNFDMQTCNLITQIEDSIRDNQSYANQYKVELRFLSNVDEIKVKVDSQRLQQVLANLISNAVKFSSKNNYVDIKIKVINDIARIEISDYGTGIPKEFHKRIFQKFAQADSSDTRQIGGTGLGLSISREIIEQMNGEIGFESTEGEGATFYFELPIIT